MKIEGNSTDNPKLKSKKLSNGQESLYLEYYLGYRKTTDPNTGEEKIHKNRKKKTLNLYITSKPKDAEQREANRRNIAIAKQLRMEEELKLKGGKLGVSLINSPKEDFFELFQAYNDKYDKKDYRMMTGALKRFRSFIEEEYSIYKYGIMPEQLTKEMMEKFVHYLQKHSKGEGASNYFQHFKKVVKYLCENDVIKKNPCNGVICKIDKTALRKHILSDEEIEAMIKTEYVGQNPNVMKAFLFCLFTGLRFCDVKDLRFSNIDYTNNMLKFEQNKTKGHSNTSNVTLSLTENIRRLIGEPTQDNKGNNIDEVIFKLPSYECCCKSLKRWTKKAGITKNITWHCARHTFGTMLVNINTNPVIIAALLGHSGLKYVTRYTRAVNENKKTAIESVSDKFKL